MTKVIDRKSLDKIASSVGGLLAVGLLVAGGLMTWAYNFTNDPGKDPTFSSTNLFTRRW